MNRKDAVAFLHDEKGYSRRMSAKLVDVAIRFDGMLAEALKKSIERKLDKRQKPKEKIKFIIKK